MARRRLKLRDFGGKSSWRDSALVLGILFIRNKAEESRLGTTPGCDGCTTQDSSARARAGTAVGLVAQPLAGEGWKAAGLNGLGFG